MTTKDALIEKLKELIDHIQGYFPYYASHDDKHRKLASEIASLTSQVEQEDEEDRHQEEWYAQHLGESRNPNPKEQESKKIDDYFELIYDSIPYNIENLVLPDFVREELANIINAKIRQYKLKEQPSNLRDDKNDIDDIDYNAVSCDEK